MDLHLTAILHGTRHHISINTSSERRSLFIQVIDVFKPAESEKEALNWPTPLTFPCKKRQVLNNLVINIENHTPILIENTRLKK
ncbi:hypothetical protein VNO77_05528 [Canavalia gladiata]|uniref:Uncharacterized protein n=1 Tax=Canavalia gladiata TaxID=3824 RepID=A0AAN9MZ71_CANGL